MNIVHLILPFALIATLAAGEAPKPPMPSMPSMPPIPPAPTVPPIALNVPPPQLGVKVDEKDDKGFDGAGVYVTQVSQGTTAMSMGLQVGDHIATVNGKAVAKTDELKVILNAMKLGDKISLDVVRQEGAEKKKYALASTLDQPKSLWRQIEELKELLRKAEDRNKELEAKLAERVKKRDIAETLQELANTLAELKAGWPTAAAEFKRQYPKGRLEFKFELDFSTDTNAANPTEIKADPKKVVDPKPDAVGKPEAKPKTDPKAGETKKEGKP